jgi:hypothetical protein
MKVDNPNGKYTLDALFGSKFLYNARSLELINFLHWPDASYHKCFEKEHALSNKRADQLAKVYQHSISALSLGHKMVKVIIIKKYRFLTHDSINISLYLLWIP